MHVYKDRRRKHKDISRKRETKIMDSAEGKLIISGKRPLEEVEEKTSRG
jgi:hypothetical protein